MKKGYALIIVFIFLVSCKTMEKNDRISRRNDFFNRLSKKEMKATSNWKMGDDILVLRKNKTFRYYSKVIGIVNSGYYSGTYTYLNNSILFNFHRNHKPAFFENDTLYIERKEDFFVLKNKNSNNYLVIN